MVIFSPSGEYMTEKQQMTTTQYLITVMEAENTLLDSILSEQAVLRQSITNKNWTVLQNSLEKLQMLADQFVALEEKRTVLADGRNLASDAQIAPLLLNVRSKLHKSKIENDATTQYVDVSRKFLQQVFDSVVPQRRNTLYSRNGSIVKPEINSVVLNQLL
jgi:hypothetical protein